MMPLTKSKTESSSERPRTRVGRDSDFSAGVCAVTVGALIRLSNSQFVGRFERSSTTTADDRGAVSASQRVSNLDGALGAVKKIGLGFRFGDGSRVRRHAEGKCSIEHGLASRGWRMLDSGKCLVGLKYQSGQDIKRVIASFSIAIQPRSNLLLQTLMIPQQLGLFASMAVA